MFTQQLPPGVFAAQREFIRVMEANRDFVWWAETLVTEETKELKEAYEADIQDMDNIFKEIADLIYVVCGFYNTMPTFAPEILTEEKNQELQRILDEAAVLLSTVAHDLKIPLPLMVAAFEIVHQSNMSKLGEDGKPIRREDGKILKGPNYSPPSMAAVVAEWKKVVKNITAKGVLGNA